MTLRLQLSSIAALSGDDRQRIAQLMQAVYPEQHSGSTREWATGEFCIRGWNSRGELVSYLRICRATAHLDGAPIQLGGIGGVKTHPDHRGSGYASACIAAAMKKLADIADFGLLVCRDELVGFYEERGWRLFPGQFIVRQFGEREVFTFNQVMVCDLASEAAVGGVLELAGPPW